MGPSSSVKSLGWGQVPLVEGEGDVFEEFWVFVEDGVRVNGVDDGDAPTVLACNYNQLASVFIIPWSIWRASALMSLLVRSREVICGFNGLRSSSWKGGYGSIVWSLMST